MSIQPLKPNYPGYFLTPASCAPCALYKRLHMEFISGVFLRHGQKQSHLNVDGYFWNRDATTLRRIFQFSLN